LASAKLRPIRVRPFAEESQSGEGLDNSVRSVLKERSEVTVELWISLLWAILDFWFSSEVIAETCFSHHGQSRSREDDCSAENDRCVEG
jgi:hypothetical protein